MKYAVGGRLKVHFPTLAVLSAVTCFGLAFVFLFVPELMLSLWSVAFSDSVGLVCRRSAALFAGIGIMLFKLRHVAPSPARAAVATGVTVACSMLALLGMVELSSGHAGPGILLAVTVEIALALAFRLAS